MSQESTIATAIRAGEGAERQAVIDKIESMMPRYEIKVALIDLLQWLRRRDQK